jgi:hypothetical protein
VAGLGRQEQSKGKSRSLWDDKQEKQLQLQIQGFFASLRMTTVCCLVLLYGGGFLVR